MTDEDTIKCLREQNARLTRANEILIAQRDELRMIFHRPQVARDIIGWSGGEPGKGYPIIGDAPPFYPVSIST